MKWSSMERKTWRGYCLGKRNVLRFDSEESREGFCWRGRGGHSVQRGWRHKKRGDQQWKVVGVWSWRVSEAEQECRRVCEVEDSNQEENQCFAWQYKSSFWWQLNNTASSEPAEQRPVISLEYSSMPQTGLCDECLFANRKWIYDLRNAVFLQSWKIEGMGQAL